MTFLHCHDGVTDKTVGDLITKAIEDAGLNVDHCRGQGYDGAGNMTGKYSGAAKLIQNVHKSALYDHCFSHQLNPWRAQEQAKSCHHFTIKSVVKLPYNPRIWKTMLRAHFQQFMIVFGDCSIFKTMFNKKNR